MIKVDIVTGFLGAGKTTLIKFLSTALINSGEKIVIIENEFGEIGIDGTALEIRGLNVFEITSGCLCCSVKGDFVDVLHKIESEINPDRILIEPSGIFVPVDIFDIFKDSEISSKMKINSITTIIDSLHYLKQRLKYKFFFENQIKYAESVVMSKTENVSSESISLIRMDVEKINPNLPLHLNSWEKMSDEDFVGILDSKTPYAISNKPSNISNINIINQQNDKEISKSGNFQSKTENNIDIATEIFVPNEFQNVNVADISEKVDSFQVKPSNGKNKVNLSTSFSGISSIKKQSVENPHAQKGHKSFQSFSLSPEQLFTKVSLLEILKSLYNIDFGIVLRVKGFVRKDSGYLEFNYVDRTIDITDMTYDPMSPNVYFIGENLNKEALKNIFLNPPNKA